MKGITHHIFDELLVIKAQQGDMEAFSLLVKRWHPALLKQAYRLTRNDEASLDVVQESWHAIAKGMGSLNNPAAFKTWAYRIVSNKSANWIKEQQKRRANENEYDVIEDAVSELDNSQNQIRKALARLPLETRALLSMFYIESHSVKEISRILGVNEGTVKSRLFYARKTLKEEFENLNKER
jgi:RNA polymerase sigma-70 factor (ECF subfamily)